MQFNPVNVSTMVPYITSQVGKNIKDKFRISKNVVSSTASLTYINPDTSVRTAVLNIPEVSHPDGATKLFNTVVVPTFDTDSPIWRFETDPSKNKYGQLY